MNPAYSVIVFTCASGAGYGLLGWLSVAGIVGGGATRSFGFGLVAFGLAFALITLGLVSSTAHLGRPERAWRAFSQWRTSWLSREGVMAIVTYSVGGIYALLWIFGAPGGSALLAALGLLTLGCVIATLWCTGMIYASLTTIRAWNHWLVAPLYVGLGLMTGLVVVNLLIAFGTGHTSTTAVWLTLVLILGSWIAKAVYWSEIDGATRGWSIGAATGLGRFGKVRPLDPPHTQPNFIMREMGFQVARRHAEQLRRLAVVALFLVPAVCTMLLLLGGAALAVLLTLVATLSVAIGIGVERWLFFAEAEHVAMLFYGRDAA
jgi:sulfite dehydrogenase (quinone) subunit SoeC